MNVVSAFAATIAGAAVLVAALQLVLRLTRERYTLELGEVQSQLESTEKTLRPSPSQVSVHIDQLMSDLTEKEQGKPFDLEQVRKEVSDLVKAEVGKQRQAEDQRAELILSDQYHKQGLAQSNIAFQLSLVFAVLGFLIIAASVIVVLVSSRTDPAIISLVSGTVVEAVSALFFVQANQARRLMVEFFDRLRVDRSVEEALKLSAKVPDHTIRSRLSTLLSVRLAKADATDEVLRTVMSTDSTETPSPEAGASS